MIARARVVTSNMGHKSRFMLLFYPPGHSNHQWRRRVTNAIQGSCANDGQRQGTGDDKGPKQIAVPVAMIHAVIIAEENAKAESIKHNRLVEDGRHCAKPGEVSSRRLFVGFGRARRRSNSQPYLSEFFF